MDERIYTPESQIRHPLHLLQQMASDVWAARYLAWRMLLRDLQARYRQTALGFLWIFIPPLAVAFGMAAATDGGVIRIAATDIPYPAYVVSSVALWQTFTDALNAPLQAIHESRTVLARINFPREALLMARLGEAIMSFAVRVILIGGVFVWYRVSMPSSGMLAIPTALALVVLGFGIGLLIAPLAALYQDLSKGLPVVLGFWLFISPVLYPVPQGPGLFARLVGWNPVTPLLVTVREVATGAALTQLGGYVFVALLALAATLIAWIVYKLALPYIVERLSA